MSDMITEDFCSFEVAKLLKEKGFDELCIFKYNSEGVRMKAGVAIDEWQNSELDEDECSCVSHQMAMKWLREVHNINIEIRCYKNIVEAFIMTIEDLPKCLVRGISSNNYEETVEAACIYALKNLI